MNKYTLLLIAISIGATVLVMEWIKTPEIIETVKTEVVQDTTVVDSLKEEVQCWKEIAEQDRDTVVVNLPTPIPTDSAGFNKYDIPYSDSTLSARIGLTVDGTLKETVFEYTIKRELVTQINNTITRTRYVETERTITRTIQPTGYFSVEVTASTDLLAPGLSYTTKNQNRFVLGYDIVNEAPVGTISIPIKNLNPFKLF